jgi:hypothetical protein
MLKIAKFCLTLNTVDPAVKPREDEKEPREDEKLLFSDKLNF